jgi:hypothetical protein
MKINESGSSDLIDMGNIRAGKAKRATMFGMYEDVQTYESLNMRGVQYMSSE